MTPEMVNKIIEEIVVLAKKNHADAHELEDSLRYDVLNAIARGTCVDPPECARLALTTGDIDFNRWTS